MKETSREGEGMSKMMDQWFQKAKPGDKGLTRPPESTRVSVHKHISLLTVSVLMKWGFLSVAPHTTTIHIRLLYRLVHRESGVKYPSTSSNIEIGSPTAMVQIILLSKNN